jgi:simple sugar transport system substrate-binding protein
MSNTHTRAGATILLPVALGSLLLSGCTTGGGGDDPIATGEGWCADTRIVYFQGGDADPFASILGKGATQAAEDTGADLEIIQSGWDFDKMIDQFRQTIASGPDAISFMGHPGDPAIMPLAQEAEDAGILVDYANVPPQETIEAYGSGFVGANLAYQGQVLAEKAVADFGLVAGDTAIVFGAFGVPGREDREEAAAQALEDAGLVVQRITEPDGSSGDPNLLTPSVGAALSSAPDAKLLILAGGPQLGGAPLFLDAAGIAPGDIYVAGFDLGASVIDAFKDGYVQLTADQEPYKQGYLPVLSLCLQAKYGLGPMTVDTSAGFVTVDNYESVEELTAAGIR